MNVIAIIFNHFILMCDICKICNRPTQQNRTIVETLILANKKSLTFNGDEYKELLSYIDNTFEREIAQTYVVSSFNSAIFDVSDIDDMVNKYKKAIKYEYSKSLYQEPWYKISFASQNMCAQDLFLPLLLLHKDMDHLGSTDGALLMVIQMNTLVSLEE